MTAASRFLALAFVIALSGSALAFLGYLTFDLSPIPAEVAGSTGVALPDPAPAGEAAAVPDVALAPRAGFLVVVERPLFSQSRRPGAAAPLSASEAGDGDIGALLVGIIFAEVGSIAMLKPQGGDALLRLQEGDRLNGWELASIEPQSVLFRRAGEETLLSLDFSSGWAKRRLREPRRPIQRSTGSQNAADGDENVGGESNGATVSD